MTVNERVKAIRHALRLTQKEMGNRLTLAQTYLSQIEKGDRDVTDKIFKIICLEFNIREEYLRDGVEPMFNTGRETPLDEITLQYHLSDLDKAILKTFLELSPEKRAVFQEITSSFISNISDNALLSSQFALAFDSAPEPAPKPAARISDEDIERELADSLQELFLESEAAEAPSEPSPEPPTPSEAPASSEPPALSELPNSSEPPVLSELPVSSEPPVLSEPPASSEPPALSELPASSKPLVSSVSSVPAGLPEETLEKKDA